MKWRFQRVKRGEKSKILNFLIFWFFNFFDRLYSFTWGPDLYTARGLGHGSCSTYFKKSSQVAAILIDLPLTGYRVKWPPTWWKFTLTSKTKIRPSMRDPNFRKGRLRRNLALGKTRFWNRSFSIFGRHFKGLKRTCKVLKRIFASNCKEGNRILYDLWVHRPFWGVRKPEG